MSNGKGFAAIDKKASWEDKQRQERIERKKREAQERERREREERAKANNAKPADNKLTKEQQAVPSMVEDNDNDEAEASVDTGPSVTNVYVDGQPPAKIDVKVEPTFTLPAVADRITQAKNDVLFFVAGMAFWALVGAKIVRLLG